MSAYLIDVIRDNNVDIDELEKQFGITSANDPPFNFKEITEEEFAKSHFFVYTPIATGYSQVYLDRANGFSSENFRAMRFFFMHDNRGYAMSSDYWEGGIHYYSFGCSHDYRQLSMQECRARNITHFGRCYHVYECNICHYIDAVDSSD